MQNIIYFKTLCQRIVLLTCVDPLFLLIYHFVNALTGKSIIYHVSICWLSGKSLKYLGKVFPKGTEILHFSKLILTHLTELMITNKITTLLKVLSNMQYGRRKLSSKCYLFRIISKTVAEINSFHFMQVFIEVIPT